MRHILIHGPNYQSARYEYGSTPPKVTLLECTWYLVSLVDAFVRGCTTCRVAAYDVPIDACYLSWMLSCVGVRRVVLLCAMC